MYCKNCDEKFPEDVRFCLTCGAPLEEEQAQAEDVEQQPVPEPVQEPMQEPVPKPVQQPVQPTWQPTTQPPWPATPPTAYPPPQQPIQQDETVSFGEWLGTLLIPLIPCVGWLIYIIMMFVWAFGSSVKPSKKTFAKANLIVMAIGIGLWLIIMVILAATGSSLFNELNQYRYY